MSNQKTNIKGWIVAIFMIGLGVYMFIEPDLMDSAEIKGRKTVLKAIFQFIWGIWGGIALLLIGIISIVGLVKGGEEDDENNVEKSEG